MYWSLCCWIISPFIPVNFCFMYFDNMLLGEYMVIIIYLPNGLTLLSLQNVMPYNIFCFKAYFIWCMYSHYTFLTVAIYTIYFSHPFTFNLLLCLNARCVSSRGRWTDLFRWIDDYEDALSPPTMKMGSLLKWH